MFQINTSKLLPPLKISMCRESSILRSLEISVVIQQNEFFHKYNYIHRNPKIYQIAEAVSGSRICKIVEEKKNGNGD